MSLFFIDELDVANDIDWSRVHEDEYWDFHMLKIQPIDRTIAKAYIDERKPEKGAGLLAHELLRDNQFCTFTPVSTTSARAAQLSRGISTGWDDTVPELLRVLNTISRGHENSFVCAQMLLATEEDFPIGEDFEIASRPYRFSFDQVTYISAPVTEMTENLLSRFVNFDIGFDILLILFNRPFQPSWFELSVPEKKASILAIVFDAYDEESFIYAAA